MEIQMSLDFLNSTQKQQAKDQASELVASGVSEEWFVMILHYPDNSLLCDEEIAGLSDPVHPDKACEMHVRLKDIINL